MKKLVAIGIGIVALVVILLLTQPQNKNETSSTKETNTVSPELDPVDAFTDFFADWEASTEPAVQEKLPNHPTITTAFAEVVTQSFADGTPLWCRPLTLSEVKTRTIGRTDSSAVILLATRDDRSTPIALVNLVGEDSRWKISSVDCEASEAGPALGEFTFDREGFLLRESVEPPLDPNTWYLVYADGGLNGLTAALDFSTTAACTTTDDTTICADQTLFEAMPVSIQGTMTEAGVEVVQFSLLE